MEVDVGNTKEQKGGQVFGVKNRKGSSSRE